MELSTGAKCGTENVQRDIKEINIRIIKGENGYVLISNQNYPSKYYVVSTYGKLSQIISDLTDQIK